MNSGAVATLERSDAGGFMGASAVRFAGVSDPEVLEAMSVREGLILALDLNLQRMIKVASDCQTVIMAMHEHNLGVFSTITHEIKKAAEGFGEVQFVYENRSSNTEPHSLWWLILSNPSGRIADAIVGSFITKLGELDSSRSIFSGLRGGLDMTFGNVHYCVDVEGVLWLPDSFAPSTSRTLASSAAGSTTSTPVSVNLSTMLSASTPTSSPSSSPRRSTSSMSVGSDDSASSDLTSYYCLNCDTRHGLGSDDMPFFCSAKYSSDEESVDSIARAATWSMAHHQIYALILNSVNGEGPSEAPLGPPPPPAVSEDIKNVYETRVTRYSEIQCAILQFRGRAPKRFEHHDPCEMMRELKLIFETHAAVESYEASKQFFCMMEEGSSVSEHMFAMSGHAKKLSDLGIVIPNKLGIHRVLQSLPPSYKNFVMNYNMQNMNKELPELFSMLLK
ncbi:hypothetical protein QYE76_067793 [Lolium multiflorum]|uniref:RNase H type-1 domain-containing protein n=1 Tax=Lolium multiflorum TaxID=4521 RepID=A0AAD8SE66_LOLMU|nr:hypothetical protein QYE76_067793 [Lolium multiflorum]